MIYSKNNLINASSQNDKESVGMSADTCTAGVTFENNQIKITF